MAIANAHQLKVVEDAAMLLKVSIGGEKTGLSGISGVLFLCDQEYTVEAGC